MNNNPISFKRPCPQANKKDDKTIDTTGEYFFNRSPKICFLQNISSKIGTINATPIKRITRSRFRFNLKTAISSFPSIRLFKKSTGLISGRVIINPEIARSITQKTSRNPGNFTFHLTGIPLFLLTYIINGMVQIGEATAKIKFM